MNANLVVDLVVIGSGVTGLMISEKASRIGVKTLLIEKSPTLAWGPSTRNEGWLHRGTYHASSIRDRDLAIQVARRCIYGHEQVKRFAPECIEDGDLPAYALVRDPGREAEITSRWDAAGVMYRPTSRAALSTLDLGVDINRAATVFEVADVSINTRLLYRKLYVSARNSGTAILTGAQINSVEGDDALVQQDDGSVLRVRSKLFLYCAGYGVGRLFRELFGTEIPLRYWKSHLVVAPRIARYGVFYLDPHEAAVMHHGGHSIAGMNEDACMVSTPDFSVVDGNAAELRAALTRMFPAWNGAGSLDIACIKVDLAPDAAIARSLNISVTEPVAGHVCVLPGKMTEAPYVTDVLTAFVHRRFEDGVVSKRPCDTLVLATEAGCVDAA